MRFKVTVSDTFLTLLLVINCVFLRTRAYKTLNLLTIAYSCAAVKGYKGLENPRVTGSIPVPATNKIAHLSGLFYVYYF
jgi:hypothetical protein